MHVQFIYFFRNENDYLIKKTTLRENLLHLTSLMEMELDFSDYEELEFANELEEIATQIEKLPRQKSCDIVEQVYHQVLFLLY